MVDGEFAPEKERKSDDGDDEEGDDEAGAEPVVFLSLVEHDLEGADGDDEQAEAPVVDAFFTLADFGEVGRVFDQAVGEDEGDDADRDIEEEDPTPGIVVDDPAADGGTEDGRGDDGDSIDGEGHAAFLRREGVGEDGLLAGLESAAGCALKDSKEDEHAKSGGDAAEKRCDGEKKDAGHVKALASHTVGNPAGDGQDHGVGDEIAGQDPGGFFGACAERSADVGHGDVGDGGVEGLHEGGKGDGDGDGPGVGARAPGLVKCCCRCSGGHALVLSCDSSGLDVWVLPQGAELFLLGNATNSLPESGFVEGPGVCNPVLEMPESQSVAGDGMLVLGVDTCGPSGTVALARLEGGIATILGQKELAGRSYSATLVAAVGELLTENRLKVGNLGAIVVVNGPGSFTGVRVGLSAVKGLAEPAQIPTVAVSRLAILAAVSGVASAALDAHRHEVFLRVAGPEGSGRELLAGSEELAEIEPKPGRVAICDEGAMALIATAWPAAVLVRSEAPTAADAIGLCVTRILAGEFDDLGNLDGHYLRRSDAEIFGAGLSMPGSPVKQIRVRAMTAEDVDPVIQIARETHHAPCWPRDAYEKALDASAKPRRVALVAEDDQSGRLVGFVIASLIAPEAELETAATVLAHQRRGVARELFSSLKSHLRRQGVREVVLEVRAGNKAAQGFYRYLGFSEQGRRPAYYAEPVEDAVLMRLGLR